MPYSRKKQRGVVRTRYLYRRSIGALFWVRSLHRTCGRKLCPYVRRECAYCGRHVVPSVSCFENYKIEKLIYQLLELLQMMSWAHGNAEMTKWKSFLIYFINYNIQNRTCLILDIWANLCNISRITRYSKIKMILSILLEPICDRSPSDTENPFIRIYHFHYFTKLSLLQWTNKLRWCEYNFGTAKWSANIRN